MRFYKPEDLFRVTTELEIEVVEIDGARIVLVDHFYQTPDLIRQLILETPAPIWKTTPGGKNFVDYHDCRHQTQVDEAFMEAQKAISVIAKKYLRTEILQPIQIFNTNYFQLIHPQPANTVPVPHEDGHCLAALVSFNTPQECRGGTGFYSCKFNQVANVSRLSILEHAALFEWIAANGLFETGDDYFLHDWQDYWELVYLAEMQYNRLIMYNGPIFHGAYHVDNQFMDYPRINHMMFFDTVRFG